MKKYLLLLVACLLSGQLQALEPADEFEFNLIGRIELFQQRLSVRDIAVTNSLAVAAADSVTGLAVIDISDPDAAALLGHCRVPGVPLSVGVIGNYALVGTMSAGLQVVDISDPQQPIVVQSLATAHGIWDICVDDTLAYLAATSLVVVNCVNPLAPQVVAEHTPPTGSVRHCAISGSHAFLALGYSGMEIIDITNPAAPVHITTDIATAKTEAVALRGNYAYLAAGDFGMVIVNVANPGSPFNVGACETGSQALDVAVYGNYAYLANDSEGLRIINVANPSMPFNVGAYNVISGTEAVVIDLEHLYVGDSRGFLIFSLTNPQQPPLVAQISNYQRATQATSLSLSPDGYSALITSYSGEVDCISLYDLNDPDEQWHFNTPGQAWEAVMSEDQSMVYIADGTAGLYVRQVYSSFELQVPVGNCDGICRRDSMLYLGAGSGVVIVNIADQFNPVVVNSLALPGIPSGIYVRDSLVYAAVWNTGLQIMNVGNPSAPELLGTCLLPGTINDVVVRGNLAYLACGNAGLCIVDIANPSAPYLVAQYITPGWAASLDISWPWVVVADWEHGAIAIQVQVPTQSRFGGQFDNLHTLGAAFHDGGLLLLDQDELLFAQTATCGDVNVDRLITISDVVALINHLFAGWALPAGARPDVNADGTATVTDAVYLVNYIFAGGAAPCAAVP